MQSAEDQVAGQRGLDAHFGRLRVAHFAHQNDIGRLPQHGPNDASEVQPNGVLDFHLVDTRQIIFHRVLRRDDLAVWRVHFVQCRVERGGLAGTGRPGHQENPVGPFDQVVKRLEIGLRQPQLADADLDVVLVQQPHHARLAMVGGQHAHPQIQLFIAHRHLDPPILGPPAFGDIHFAHDLDPGQQGAQQASGGTVPFDQHAINAVANADAVFERFNVNVRGPQLHRFVDDQVGQADDRRAGFVDLLFRSRLHRLGFGEIDRRIGEILQHRVGALAVQRAVVLIDGLQDALPRSQRDLDLAVQDKTQLVEGVQVQRIADDHAEGLPFVGHGEDDVFTSHRFGNQFDHRRRDHNLFQVHVVQMMLFRNRPHHVVAGGVAQPDQRVTHAGGRLAGHRLGLVQLIRADHALTQENVGKTTHAGRHISMLGQGPLRNQPAAPVTKPPREGRHRWQPDRCSARRLGAASTVKRPLLGND